MDGTNRTVIESYKIFYPTSLRLDLANEQIYWLDKYMGYIERVDYNGHNRWSLKATIGSAMRQMHAIALFESQIYVTKPKYREMWRINRRNSSSAERMFVSEEQPVEMRIFHAQTQPSAPNPCVTESGAQLCEHICVLARGASGKLHPKCICTAGYQLKNRTKCVLLQKSTFLIYAKQSPAMIRGISIDNDTRNGTPFDCMVPILNVKSQWPLDLDYSVKDQVIYFSQSDM